MCSLKNIIFHTIRLTNNRQNSVFLEEHYLKKIMWSCSLKNIVVNFVHNIFDKQKKKLKKLLSGVDHKGLEPLTPSMPWKYSSQLS